MLFVIVEYRPACCHRFETRTPLGLLQLHTFGASEVGIGNATCSGSVLISLVDWGNCRRLMWASYSGMTKAHENCQCMKYKVYIWFDFDCWGGTGDLYNCCRFSKSMSICCIHLPQFSHLQFTKVCCCRFPCCFFGASHLAIRGGDRGSIGRWSQGGDQCWMGMVLRCVESTSSGSNKFFATW